MILHRGLACSRAQNIVEGTEQIAATSNGEFGKGSYYWKNDVAAGVISALQYYGQAKGGWAVLAIKVAKDDIVNLRGTILNFRDDGRSNSFDPGSMTALRPVSVDQFDNAVVRMRFDEFRKINASPEEYGLAGRKNQLEWPNYTVIAGPTAAAPKEVNLTQIKFAGDGIDVLNDCEKKILHSGDPVNNNTFAMVGNWRLQDRQSIYTKYFLGREKVTLQF